MTRIIASVLAACTLAAAGVASAQTVEARISHGDLDLTTTAGVQTFEARVTRAGQDFCRQARLLDKPDTSRADCQRDFRAEAIQKLPDHAQVAYAMNRQAVGA
jgi:UrcA family protein